MKNTVAGRGPAGPGLLPVFAPSPPVKYVLDRFGSLLDIFGSLCFKVQILIIHRVMQLFGFILGCFTSVFDQLDTHRTSKTH